MRILYVTDVFPPHCGGSGWSVYFFAKALRDRGHEIEIVSLDGRSRNYDGFAVKTYSLHSGLPFLSNWIRENRELPRIASELQQQLSGVDIAHAHHKWSAVALGLAQPKRFFATVRDYWPICLCGESRFRTGESCDLYDFTRCSENISLPKGLAAPLAYPFLEPRFRTRRSLLQRAEKIFCISHYLRSQFAPFFSAEQLAVLPNFADQPAALPETAGLPDRYCVFIGKLEQNKGAHLLPEIMQKSGGGIPLVLVGEGSMKGGLQAQFVRHGVDATILGYREHPEMLSVLSRAEFVLFPSIWAEPLGRVLLEAAMMGKASVCFSHPGGHHDIVRHRVNALLADSIDGFAEAVAELNRNDGLRAEMGRQSRAIYEEHFSPSAVIPQLLQHYA